MKKILVSTISFVNSRKSGSEIYTTFAKRLISDVINKTPWDIRVSTNQPEFFEEVLHLSDRVSIKNESLDNHKTHVGAFNQLLKFSALKDIEPNYDWVLYLDCDAGFIDQIDTNDVERMIDYWENLDYDMLALRTNATYDEALSEFQNTIDFNSWPKPLFNPKFLFYGEHPQWSGAKLPSEHILFIKNTNRLSLMAQNLENFCTQFETQDENYPITYDMEAFEIGVSAHLSGINMGEMGWGNQTEIFKVGFNANNWEKIKI